VSNNTKPLPQQERRKDSDSAEYARALRKRARRRKDRQTKLLHYSILTVLFIIIFSNFVIALILEMST